MDVAALSVAKANSDLRLEASFAMTNQVKRLSEEVGQQFLDMVEKSAVPVPHPTLGHSVDIKA